MLQRRTTGLRPIRSLEAPVYLVVQGKRPAFRKAILKYSSGGKRRSFPWREPGRSPYDVLIAEVLLKRTTSTAAARVYEEFLRKFPDAMALRIASRKKIVAVLAKVGLQWQRAEAAKKLAAYLVESEDGKVPRDLDRLMLIPGVGDYTARAVLSVGFGFPAAVVDSNVERILLRVFMHSLPARPSWPILQSLADSLLPQKRHREFNLGMIDLGALLCRPKFPRCRECPLSVICDYSRSVRKVGAHSPTAVQTQMGNMVRRLRKEKGFSLAQLTHNAKVSKLTLIKIESGKTIPLTRTLQKLWGALGLSGPPFASTGKRVKKAGH